jgi:hypothetical protein
MGNTPSQEAPRATSRKLSKPRVAGRDGPRNRVTASAPASELAVHHTKAAQFSNSYLVGTVPIPASQRPSVDVVSPGPATAVFHDNPHIDPATNDLKSATSAPKSPTQYGFNELLRAERIERRRSTGHASINGSASPSRAPSRQGNRNSIPGIARSPRYVHKHTAEPHLLLSTENLIICVFSVQTTRTQSGARDVPSIVEEPLPRSQSLVERRASLHSRSNSRGGESQDAVCNMRRNSTTPQPESLPPHRTQSETSLYPPHRRRSLIMTPGVATRAEAPQKLRRKASFRRSMEPTPSVSRENSIDSKTWRHMSLPVLPSKSELAERAPTPSEAEYKQLGVMMFGTLRITNGAPASSPGQEPDEVTLYVPTKVGREQTNESRGQFAASPRSSAFDEFQIQTRKGHPQLTIEPASPRSPKTMAPAVRDPSQHSPLSPRQSSPRLGNDQQLPVTVRPPTPELQTTSKHAAVDDQLFEEEDDSPRPEPTEPVTQVIEVAQQLDVGIKSPTRPSLVHVSRKDSGYVSNTSKSSRKSLSTVDSGYSSNVSVRSVRQKRATTGGTDYLSSVIHSSESTGSSPIAEPSNGASPMRTDDTPTPPEDYLQPSISSKDDGSLSTPRTSTSSTSLSIIRLPSLRSGKSREQKPSRKSSSQDRPKSSGNLLQRVSSHNGNNSHRMSGLRRLLSGGSRKELSTSYAVHEFDGGVPSVPTAVEEQLQGHSARFPTAPKRLALRAEPSQDSLGTILSVEDSSEAGVSERPSAPQPQPRQPKPEPQRYSEPIESTRPERRKSARLSISSVGGSITGAATSILSPKSSSSPRNVVRRRSTMDERKTQRAARDFGADSDSDDDVVVDGSLVDERDFMVPNARRSVGNSAFDQALLGMSDQGRYPTPDSQSWMKEPYVDPRASRRQPQLRSRKSAPDVRQTMAGHLSPVFERDSVMMTSKTPPPISMQTRGSKKRRGGHKSSRRQSSPAGVPQYRPPVSHDPYDSTSSVPSSSEDLGHYPYAAAPPPIPAGPYPRAAPLPQQGQWSAPTPKMRRPLFGQRYSYDGHGYRPPSMQQQQSALAPMPSREQSKDHWMPNRHIAERQQSSNSRDGHEPKLHSRPSSSRMSVEGSSPPFRVLHSYNSPAYKGIPIWG